MNMAFDDKGPDVDHGINRAGALLRPVLALIDGLCRAGAAIAALATAVLAVMLIAEVFSVNLFNWSQPWVVEYGSYLLAAILFAGSGWTLNDGGHIRVAVLTANVTPGVSRILDIAATLWGLGFIGYAAWALFLYAHRSYELGSVSTYLSRTPVAWPQTILAASVGLLWLALLGRLLRLIANLPPESPPAPGEPRE